MQTHQGLVALDLLFKVSSKVSHGLLLFCNIKKKKKEIHKLAISGKNIKGSSHY